MDHCEIFFEVVDESSDSPAQDLLSTMVSGPFESETWALIRLWEDNIGELRRQRRNAGVYETIRLGVGPVSITKTRQQVWDKGNLNQTYRFLGSLPMNDSSLVDDSIPEDLVEVYQKI
ncbi:hypothetical protein HPB47_018850 [Ixodes persulcatus]|uniref:Uncharacterized protein n=1 Tax=Ixodes persulcatus TaxID=34615 RepID=A0AC60R189_IXOPE|nr:hypothetical protein HPB47_018850 [Ixodes persulcatus]